MQRCVIPHVTEYTWSLCYKKQVVEVLALRLTLLLIHPLKDPETTRGNATRPNGKSTYVRTVRDEKWRTFILSLSCQSIWDCKRHRMTSIMRKVTLLIDKTHPAEVVTTSRLESSTMSIFCDTDKDEAERAEERRGNSVPCSLWINKPSLYLNHAKSYTKTP